MILKFMDKQVVLKAENYNIEIGEKFAVEKAKDKIWEVLGFVLQWGINGIKNK